MRPAPASPVDVAADVRVDPYWLWARATGFEFLDRDTSAIPVLLELAVTLAEASALADAGRLPAGLTLPARYRRPATGLASARHCTAQASPAFLEAVARGRHADLVVRCEIGLPIGSDGAPAASARPQAPMSVPRAAPRTVRGTFPTVLAVIDDGLPIVHPALLDAAGHPKCLALWDPDGTSPSGVDDGRLLTDAGIAATIGAHPAPVGTPRDDAAVCDALALPRLRRRWTHGSAVLGLAALGRKGDGGPVPPFIGVHLPRRTSDDTSGLSLGVHVLDALHFVLGQAETSATRASQAPGPVVVNLSFGRFAGAHDGSGLLSSAIDELISLRNAAGLPLAVVLPAGNGNLSRGHARGTLAPQALHTLTWRIQPDDRTPSFVELWPTDDAAPGHADFSALSVTLRSPDGRVCGPVAADRQAVMRDAAGRTVASVIHLSRSAAGADPMVLVALAPSFSFDAATPTAPAGRWSIDLRNDGAHAMPIGAWIQRDDRFAGSRLGGRQSYFEDAAYLRFDRRGRPLDADPTGTTAWVSRAETINPIATGRYPVVVGARNAVTGRASPYSAASRSRPPQITAIADDSPVSPGIATHGTRAGTWVRASGTSLAAPQVARWLLSRVPSPAAAPCAPAPDWARAAIASILRGPAVRTSSGTPRIAPERGGAATLP
jgi:hypothetical protein